jgi:hypothetical protein
MFKAQTMLTEERTGWALRKLGLISESENLFLLVPKGTAYAQVVETLLYLFLLLRAEFPTDQCWLLVGVAAKP